MTVLATEEKGKCLTVTAKGDKEKENVIVAKEKKEGREKHALKVDVPVSTLAIHSEGGREI